MPGMSGAPKSTMSVDVQHRKWSAHHQRTWILPVKVNAVETVLVEEVDNVGRERPSIGRAHSITQDIVCRWIGTEAPTSKRYLQELAETFMKCPRYTYDSLDAGESGESAPLAVRVIDRNIKA